jgi:hypothetical protein
MRVRPALIVALTLVAAGASGCGQSSNRDTVRTTTERFLAAYKAGQGKTACVALSKDTIKELESQEMKSCPDAIGQVKIDGGAVKSIEVTVTNAKVDLSSGETVFLSEQSNGWRISALGCKPQGERTNTPFDCELQA